MATPTQRRCVSPRCATAAEKGEVDYVVVGSGLAGLSCAGLLASRGYEVAVLEQHYEIGGCAHDFNVNMDGKPVPSELLARKPEPVFRFEAGPSLYSGLSPDRSPNPLKHIFQMVGEEPEWLTYDTWGAHLPEVPEGYELSIGAENFLKILDTWGGPTAREDWAKLADELRPLSSGVMSLPSTAVRGDLGILATLGLRYPKAFVDVVANAGKIVAPFDLKCAISRRISPISGASKELPPDPRARAHRTESRNVQPTASRTNSSQTTSTSLPSCCRQAYAAREALTVKAPRSAHRDCPEILLQ